MEILNRPKLEIDEELRSICHAIQAEGKSNSEWTQIESDDWFQTERYVGGYDGTEQEFSFSYYDEAGKIWWLSFALADVARILDGELMFIDLFDPSEG